VTDPQRVLAEIAARTPEHRMDPSLEPIRDLLDLLGHPERAFPSVHLTGTNGKTSTARMVDALLTGFGLRTGRFTSPHLASVTERITLGGTPITPARLAEVFDEVAPMLALVDSRQPRRLTFFELLEGLAFAAFADAPVDVGVVEVGLGGRWDATNVLAAPVVAVTSVDLDHMNYLGDTVAEIAAEKAGIIHPGAIAVLAADNAEATEVLLERTEAVGATAWLAGVHFGLAERRLAVGGQLLTLTTPAGSYDEVFLPLLGLHQAHNAAVALATAEAFLGGGRDTLDPALVREAFARVRSPGRLELVRTSPTVLIDAAHNPAGARALAAALTESFHLDHVVGVLAVLADKDVAGLLEALEPVLSELVVTASTSPRALPVEDLEALAGEIFGADRVRAAERLDDALVLAVELADAAAPEGGGAVVVAGSVVTAGEARLLLGGADGARNAGADRGGAGDR
jgi:dihydrofolate synthase/folylpolyglutamate synthase